MIHIGKPTAIEQWEKTAVDALAMIEPEGYLCEVDALVACGKGATIADGSKPLRTGDLTFEAVRRYVDDAVLVPDSAIMEEKESGPCNKAPASNLPPIGPHSPLTVLKN